MSIKNVTAGWACLLCAMTMPGEGHGQNVGQADPTAVERSVADIRLRTVVGERVVVRGRIVEEIEADLFLFTDDTADIQLIAAPRVWDGQRATEGALLEILGDVRTDFTSTPQIEAKRVTVLAR